MFISEIKKTINIIDRFLFSQILHTPLVDVDKIGGRNGVPSPFLRGGRG
jgi:hypothetical protein